jgi:tetratricopeptide (TPR) repeat protein
MPVLFKKIFPFVLILTLFSCSKTNRERSKIPPSPFQSKTVQDVAAIEALTDAIRSNPSIAENYYKRAIVLLRMRESDKALEDINQADKIKKSVGKYLLLKAKILRELKKYDEALIIAQGVELLNIETPEFYTLIGDLTQRKGDFARASQYLAKSLQLAPYEGETYYYQGILAARQKDTVAAIYKMLKAIELKPSFEQGYSDLTIIFKNRGLIDSAMTINRRAMKQFPQNTDFMVDRGLIFHRAGRMDSALVYYDKAFQSNARRTDALLYAASIYFKWKSFSKALEYYEKALKADPKTPRINYFIGITFEQLNSLTKAEEFLKNAVIADGNDMQAIIALNRVSEQINIALGIYKPPIPLPQKVTYDTENLPVFEEPKKNLDTSRVRVKYHST